MAAKVRVAHVVELFCYYELDHICHAHLRRHQPENFVSVSYGHGIGKTCKITTFVPKAKEIAHLVPHFRITCTLNGCLTGNRCGPDIGHWVMEAGLTEEFDELLEWYRSEADHYVRTLYWLDSEITPRIDGAIDQISRSMKETLEDLRRGSETSQPIGPSFDELDDYDIRCLSLFDPNLTALLEQEENLSNILPAPELSPQVLSPDGNLEPLQDFPPSPHATSSTEQKNEEQSLAHRSNPDRCFSGSQSLAARSIQKSLNQETLVTQTSARSPRERQLLSKLVGHSPAAVAGQVSFDEFRGAVQCIRRKQHFKLPPHDVTIWGFVAFLDEVKKAEFANQLYFRVGSWRFKNLFLRLLYQFKQKRSIMSISQRRLAKTGKPSSQARGVLMTDSELLETYRNRNTDEEDENNKRLRIKINNLLSGTLVWYEICERAGSGLLCLIPPVPSTRLQRLPSKLRYELLQALEEKREGRVWRLAKLLSSHLEAILEGHDCLLGRMIDDEVLKNWDEVLDHLENFPQCSH